MTSRKSGMWWDEEKSLESVRDGKGVVMGINKIGLPKLSENMDPEDARALRSYLYQMQEQLQYVLSNLDVENMSDEMRTKLQNL